MGINIKSASTFGPEMGKSKPLEKTDALAEWVVQLPDGAQLSAIIHDLGSQRDPVPTLVGIHATWEETR